ncbi:hypothetical protein BGZ83_003805, partial [Gryganskiella cystojenkinii]
MSPPSASTESNTHNTSGAPPPLLTDGTRLRSVSDATSTSSHNNQQQPQRQRQPPLISTASDRTVLTTSSTSVDGYSSEPPATQTPVSAIPFSERILATEHKFTALTQNIAHFSPLKKQLDKHNLAIERLENEIKKKTALLRSCQDKLQIAIRKRGDKALSRRPQTSGQGSHVSLQPSSEDTETEALQEQQQATKESLDSLNGQLLAAKIL